MTALATDDPAHFLLAISTAANSRFPQSHNEGPGCFQTWT
jgi:hypothetical protein